jgi:plastocyanin
MRWGPDPMRGFSTRAGGLLVLVGLAASSACGTSAAAPSSAAAASAAAPSGAAARACLDVTGGAPWHGLRRVDGDRVTVDAYDDYFSPNCLVVPAGTPVTLVLTDRGHLPHTLIAAGSSVAVSVDASVDAGQTAFVTLPALRHPTKLACSLHEDERMLLAVVPADGGDGV